MKKTRLKCSACGHYAPRNSRCERTDHPEDPPATTTEGWKQDILDICKGDPIAVTWIAMTERLLAQAREEGEKAAEFDLERVQDETAIETAKHEARDALLEELWDEGQKLKVRIKDLYEGDKDDAKLMRRRLVDQGINEGIDRFLSLLFPNDKTTT